MASHGVRQPRGPTTHGGGIAQRFSLGQGVVDAEAAVSPWFLHGDNARTIESAKNALRGAPVGAFVIYSPAGGPVWTYRMLLKAPGPTLYHYTVINGRTGFMLKGADVSMPTLSEFVAFYAQNSSRDLPVKLDPRPRRRESDSSHHNADDAATSPTTYQPPVVMTRGIGGNLDGDVAAGGIQATTGGGGRPASVRPGRQPQKRALLIAISYHGKRSKTGEDLFLPGALYDTHRVKQALTSKFYFQDIRTINEADEVFATDGTRITESPTGGTPTRANILAGFDWLLRGALPGDQLFMHLAGHGSHVNDLDGDEEDGVDEVLVPLDYPPSFDRSKLIVDDEIFAHLILPLPKGVTLNFVIDTCHSGSLTDLQWMWDGERFRKEGPRESRGGLAVCLSGCCDDEESTDVSSFDGTSAGVLTSCWLRAIEEGHLTFQTMFSRVTQLMTSELASLRAATGRQLKQNPRMSFTQPRSITDGYFMLRRPESLTTLPLPTRDSVQSTTDGVGVGVFDGGDGHMDAFLEEEEDRELPQAPVASEAPPLRGGLRPNPASVGYRGGVRTPSPSPQSRVGMHGNVRGGDRTSSLSSPSPGTSGEQASGRAASAKLAPNSPTSAANESTSKLRAAMTARNRPDLADPKILHQLSFLKGPDSDVALEVLLEGLGEGWLKVADLLHDAQVRPQSSPTAPSAETKLDWRGIGAADEQAKRKQSRRNGTNVNIYSDDDDDDDGYSDGRDDDERRRRSNRHRRRGKRRPAGPEIHVHISGRVSAAPMTAAPRPYFTQRAHVDLQPHTTVVEETVHTEEYVVNADGSETIVNVSPSTRADSAMTGPMMQPSMWRPESNRTSHHLDGTVVEDHVYTHE